MAIKRPHYGSGLGDGNVRGSGKYSTISSARNVDIEALFKSNLLEAQKHHTTRLAASNLPPDTKRMWSNNLYSPIEVIQREEQAVVETVAPWQLPAMMVAVVVLLTVLFLHVVAETVGKNSRNNLRNRRRPNQSNGTSRRSSTNSKGRRKKTDEWNDDYEDEDQELYPSGDDARYSPLRHNQKPLQLQQEKEQSQLQPQPPLYYPYQKIQHRKPSSTVSAAATAAVGAGADKAQPAAPPPLLSSSSSSYYPDSTTRVALMPQSPVATTPSSSNNNNNNNNATSGSNFAVPPPASPYRHPPAIPAVQAAQQQQQRAQAHSLNEPAGRSSSQTNLAFVPSTPSSSVSNNKPKISPMAGLEPPSHTLLSSPPIKEGGRSATSAANNTAASVEPPELYQQNSSHHRGTGSSSNKVDSSPHGQRRKLVVPDLHLEETPLFANRQMVSAAIPEHSPLPTRAATAARHDTEQQQKNQHQDSNNIDKKKARRSPIPFMPGLQDLNSDTVVNNNGIKASATAMVDKNKRSSSSSSNNNNNNNAADTAVEMGSQIAPPRRVRIDELKLFQMMESGNVSHWKACVAEESRMLENQAFLGTPPAPPIDVNGGDNTNNNDNSNRSTLAANNTKASEAAAAAAAQAVAAEQLPSPVDWTSSSEITTPSATSSSTVSLPSDDPRKSIKHKRPDLTLSTDSAASLQGAINYSELDLVDVIGGGGFGQVWKAIWRGTPVAVKVLTGSAQSKHVPKAVLEEFAAEINLLKGMRHPNICLYMGACLDPPNRAIITELAANGSLWDALRLPLSAPFVPCDGVSRDACWPASLYAPDVRHGAPPTPSPSLRATPPRGTWPWVLVKRVATGTARGMSYLHAGTPPILHRDLKSANILLDESYTAKVCDFGLSRLKAHERSMTGNCGTVQWMSPEVLANSKYNEKADVFSFGIICWELLSRECPYDGMNAIQCALAVLNQDHRPEIPRWCPLPFHKLIRSCVKRDPEERPTFLEILRTLDDLPM